MATTYQERRWRSVDGLSLYARDYLAAAPGDQLPVICLHGLTRNSKDFEDVAPLIAGWGRRATSFRRWAAKAFSPRSTAIRGRSS